MCKGKLFELWVAKETSFLSSYFFREYCFKQQAWCQTTSNQVVLMPKLRQMACKKWLAGLGMKKISRNLLLFWNAQSCF